MTTAPRALLLDYAGVLTGPVGPAFAAFERANDIPEGRCFALLIEAATDADGGLIGAIERGELTVQAFDDELRSLLEADGLRSPAGSLLAGLFAQLHPGGELWAATARLRSTGVRTGLVSNSWGTELYPRAALDDHFDEVVISGEVGLRKPDPAIFTLACARLEVAPEETVFVDDLAANVAAARRVGMRAIHHTGDGAVTVGALSATFGVDLGPS
ncbi:HAD family hydrolase [Nitriliruptor alkaliphilus]|uniref:HAD family hydrolase n=1 Tax=Nitriliruptor alkaliphilus TaxID=427918 RepID=UPI000697BCB1|nr:HAD family phosphatase [Nitriliruptor alkaliphilus]